MTLKEKFQQWFINDEEDEHYEGMVETVSIEHEKIADEFAIGFAKYVLINHGKFKYVDLKKMLNLFKKETGL